MNADWRYVYRQDCRWPADVVHNGHSREYVLRRRNPLYRKLLDALHARQLAITMRKNVEEESHENHSDGSLARDNERSASIRG